jgi:mannosyltransferase OCH1-like enzyme
MIPNILWQTWKTKNLPESIKQQSDSWKHSNPQLEFKFMDNDECSSFILEHFGEEIHKLYNSLPQPIMRADFWRLAVVYIHGGYYSDLDIVCNKNIEHFINPNVEAVFIREINNISNYFFGATPKHPVIKTAIDKMVEEMKHITNKETQSFGMHGLHSSVREYYNVIETNYKTNNEVQFLLDSEMRNNNTLIHNTASLKYYKDYESWRDRVSLMNTERTESNDILFFTTFHKNGYDLYGKEWVSSFMKIANYYNKFRAKIYYEGFVPPESHPSIEWIKYEEVLPFHADWKKDYLNKTNHSEYVKTMTVRFSHKAFVIQHALSNNTNDYLIWLDGDCIFKDADYSNFPTNLLGENLLACQVEHNHDLNHVESGILIFNGKHKDKQKFIDEFSKWYRVENILPMGQPYDGFLVFKTLLTSGLKYVDLNANYGKGGIQSDPGMTFCHPEIKSKFIHNIGWTGKNQYSNWNTIFERDDIYKKMKGILFNLGSDEKLNEKKERAGNKLMALKRLRK